MDWALREYLGMLRVVRPRFTPEDVYIANLMGAVEALNEGITIRSLRDRAGASRDRLLAGTPYSRA